MLGMALLAFFTFMGALMQTGGRLGMAIGIAVAAVALIWGILAAAIWCKRVDSDFSRWKKVEIIAVVCFFLAAVFPARYVMHFLDIMSSQDEICEAAVADKHAIMSLFDDYYAFENGAIANTTTSMQNAFGQPCDSHVKAFLSDSHINNFDDIESLMLLERGKLIGSNGPLNKADFLSYRQSVDSVLSVWTNDVKAWDLMTVATQAQLPTEVATTVADDLSERSALAKLPIFEFSKNQYVIKAENQTKSFDAPTLKFADRLSAADSINFLFLPVYIVIILLIFLDYIMARRSVKTDIGDKTITNKDGVITL